MYMTLDGLKIVNSTYGVYGSDINKIEPDFLPEFAIIDKSDISLFYFNDFSRHCNAH